MTSVSDIIGPNPDLCQCCGKYPPATHHQDNTAPDNLLAVCWPCRLAGLLGFHFGSNGLAMFSTLSQKVREQDLEEILKIREAIMEACRINGVDDAPFVEAWDAAVPEIDRRMKADAG